MDKQALERLYNTLMYFRRHINPEMPIQQLLIYLRICLDERLTMKDIEDALEMPNGTVSRNFKVLSKYIVRDSQGNKSIEGYDLLRIEPDIEERRRNVAQLTTKGLKVAEEISKILKS